MKGILVAFGLLLSGLAYCQNNDIPAIKTDTVYVINGSLSENGLKGIDRSQLLSVDVLNKDTLAKYISDANKTLVVVITKAYAVEQYEKKFSVFSKKYKSYLRSNENVDSKTLYAINGVPLDGKPDDITKRLFELKKDNIKSVSINEKGIKEEGMIQKPLVTITTK